MRKREPEYQQIIQNLPSMKTASFEKLQMAIRLEHFDFLFSFCEKKPFLKWRTLPGTPWRHHGGIQVPRYGETSTS